VCVRLRSRGAARLDGFAATEYGWVQSYGSRCLFRRRHEPESQDHELLHRVSLSGVIVSGVGWMSSREVALVVLVGCVVAAPVRVELIDPFLKLGQRPSIEREIGGERRGPGQEFAI
jgi:hypothetical protein